MSEEAEFQFEERCSRNPLIPHEPHRLREADGQILPPPIELRPEERKALEEAETTTRHGTPRQLPQKAHVPFTDELKQRFVALLAQYGVKWKCAKAIGVAPFTVTTHLREDEDFKEACDWAMEVFRASIEEAIIDRAIHGWQEPVYSQRLGIQIGTIHRFDNRLLELLAKRHIPEYREKQQLDVNVTGGVLVAPAAPRSAEEWRERHVVQNNATKKLPSDSGESRAGDQ